MKVGVVGCSGTGSIVIEQLIRLGAGKLVLVDPKILDAKNLNRIINSTKSDVENKVPKVHMFSSFVEKSGLESKVIPFHSNLIDDRDAQAELIDCDFIFCCVDGAEGRWLVNRISTYYLVPYIDMGVKLKADGKGGVDEISAMVHFLTPGKSSIMSRGVISLNDLEAEGMARTDPDEYQRRRKEGYIANVDVTSPAVISVNMQVASLAVLEFLERLHPYRYDDPIQFAMTVVSISDWSISHFSEDQLAIDNYLRKYEGKGDEFFSN